ncbi:hypothetical protein ACHAXH_003819 [Discostella pseudostelligera]
MIMPQLRRTSRRRSSDVSRIIGLFAFLVLWVFIMVQTVVVLDLSNSSLQTTSRLLQLQYGDERQTITRWSVDHNDDGNAYAIPGIEMHIPSPMHNEEPIHFVYPEDSITFALVARAKLEVEEGRATTTTTTTKKGLVLLLHACTHSALKFFSPSPSTCPDCVGLSEELRIVRLLLEHGYEVVAVTSANRKSGCWSIEHDLHRITTVLHHDLFRNYTIRDTMYAIGASSGGKMASELAVRNIVRGAVVMVAAMSENVVQRLRASPKPIYLAHMPRDKRTMASMTKNYQDLENVKDFIRLDGTSCDAVPVTTEYLVRRVVGLTPDVSNHLVSQLKTAGHIDSISNMLILDPTKSNWRDVVSPENSTNWLNAFDLRPGYSPLAKALHRAWAFHEYCSEVVDPALRFWEYHALAGKSNHAEFFSEAKVQLKR